MVGEDKRFKREQRKKVEEDMRVTTELIDPEFAKFYHSIYSALEVIRAAFTQIIFRITSNRHKIEKLESQVTILEESHSAKIDQIQRQLDELKKR